MRKWKVWNYAGFPLGTVEAETLGAAMKAARLKWPNDLQGDRLFDIIAA